MRHGDSKFPSLLPHRNQHTKTSTIKVKGKRTYKKLVAHQTEASEKQIYKCEEHVHKRFLQVSGPILHR
jgi:hypothetical protein